MIVTWFANEVSFVRSIVFASLLNRIDRWLNLIIIVEVDVLHDLSETSEREIQSIRKLIIRCIYEREGVKITPAFGGIVIQ